MSRVVFHGGSVFDGTGADPATADVAVEQGFYLPSHGLPCLMPASTKLHNQYHGNL